MFHAWGDYNERIQDKENLIPADEPVFLLLAQDGLMLSILYKYVSLLAETPGRDENIMIETLRQIDRVREWQATHAVKYPDVPAECLVPRTLDKRAAAEATTGEAPVCQVVPVGADQAVPVPAASPTLPVPNTVILGVLFDIGYYIEGRLNMVRTCREQMDKWDVENPGQADRPDRVRKRQVLATKCRKYEDWVKMLETTRMRIRLS